MKTTPSNVLLVMDNIQSARHLKNLLGGNGYSVKCWTLGEAATQGPLSAPPDTVVFDTLLLDDEEISVFHRFRQHRGWCQVPVLVIGTILDQESSKKIRSLGADEFVAKPIDPTELLVKLQAMLRLRSCEPRTNKDPGNALFQSQLPTDPLSNLRRIAASQASEQSIETILVQLLRRTRSLIHFDEAFVCAEVQEGRYGVLAHVGGGNCDLASYYEVGDSYTGWIALEKKPLLVRDVDKESRVRILGRDQGLNKSINSFVGLPLIDADHVIGTLELASYSRNAFDENTVKSLLPVAQIALLATQNARICRAFTEHIDALRGQFLMTPQQEQPVYRSQALERVIRAAERVKDGDCAVLITGETGTGKELVARLIHYDSRRRNLPFIDLNCAAIPDALQESELFGIEKGTATGVDKRLGKLETVGAGTLFLDEIADMPLGMQAKMLRVLEDRTFERLGGDEKLRFRARIITATSRDITQTIRENRFREELYYRLAVVHLHIPPLRERKEDIPPLVHHFVKRFCMEQGRPLLSVHEQVMRRFLEHCWPGNIRELRNAIERSVLFTQGTSLQPCEETATCAQPFEGDSRSEGLIFRLAFEEKLTIPEFIEMYSQFAFERLGCNKSRACQFLGINYRTLQKKLAENRRLRTDMATEATAKQ